MKKKLKNLIFIIILGSVCAGMLLGIRAYTLPIIKAYQEMMLKMTILNAAGISYTKENLDQVFLNDIKKEIKDNFTYYLSPQGAYIFEYKGRGLWGMIEGVISLGPDLETIESLQILSQEETPGLGGRIGEESYLDKFKDKKVDPLLKLALRKKASEADEVDAITGATISSQALVDTINDSVEGFRKIMR